MYKRQAKVQPEEKRHLQRRMTITGTHGYRAPEVYDRDYGKAADWWNVGILIIEMLTADNPLRGNNRKESEHLTKHKDLQLPRTIKADAQSIALAFLHRDPAARLGTPHVRRRQDGVPHVRRGPRAERDQHEKPHGATSACILRAVDCDCGPS